MILLCCHLSLVALLGRWAAYSPYSSATTLYSAKWDMKRRKQYIWVASRQQPPTPLALECPNMVFVRPLKFAL